MWSRKWDTCHQMIVNRIVMGECGDICALRAVLFPWPFFPAGSTVALNAVGGLVVTGPVAAGAAAGTTGATLLSIPTWGLVAGGALAAKSIAVKAILVAQLASQAGSSGREGR